MDGLRKSACEQTARTALSLVVSNAVLLAVLSASIALGFSDNSVHAAENYYNEKRFRVNSRKLVTMVGVPAEYDPASDELYARCAVSASRVKGDEIISIGKAKGEFSAELWILDVDSGAIERYEMEAGTFKTRADRLTSWRYEMDLLDFEDDGLVPFIRTVVRFTSSKKANFIHTFCLTGFSKN